MAVVVFVMMMMVAVMAMGMVMVMMSLMIMVVIVILGLLVAVVAPNVLQNQDKAMVEKARADIALLEQSLDLYKLDSFVYPTMIA